MNHKWKKAAGAVFAVLLAFLTANGLCWFYYRMPGWYERSGNATAAVWQPDSRMAQALEGYGSHTVDGNGYVNPQKLLADSDYILVLGSSHTMGENVLMEEKYTTLLDQMLYGDSDRLHVYNMAQHGHYFPELAAGFAAAVREFPDSSTVILEITDTKFPLSRLEAGLDSRPFDQAELGSRIALTADAKKSAQTAVKTAFPLFSFLSGKQFAGYRLSFDGAFGLGRAEKNESRAGSGGADVSAIAEEEERYRETLGQIIGNLREQYDGRIIVLYHPKVELKEDGTMEIIRDVKTLETFTRVCEDYQVDWIDVGDRFTDRYREHWEVPYGFSNTEPGKGHLNRYGHRIMAEALYEAIEGGEAS